MTFDELLERRLLIVAGKGGVGKTTVSCLLGLEAARRGKRVLLCEVDGLSRAPTLLGAEPAALGEAVEAKPGLCVMAIEGKAALAEYLGLIIPVRRLLQTVFKSRVYQYFVAAAPGLKELMTIGKIWYEAERENEDGEGRRWDLVLMDAPATGHSLQYLRMPAAAVETFGAGLVQREARRLVDLLTDPARTAVNLVTTAEEMPVNETIGMYRQLCDELHMPAGYLFVNRVHDQDFADADVERVRRAAKRMKKDRERDILSEVATRAAEEAGWTRLNARYRERLAKEVPLPALELPHLFAEEFGDAEVKRLGRLLADPEATVTHRERRA
jgi:anion-transporting  ArsA/GET3 family ATPase